MPTQSTTSAACPECEAAVQLPEDALQGEIVACDDCAAELEIVTLEPAPELALAPEIQEDWGE